MDHGLSSSGVDLKWGQQFDLSRGCHSFWACACNPQAMVMEALTAENEYDNENYDFFEICYLVQDNGETIIKLMEQGGLDRLDIRLLAAKTMANILVIKQAIDPNP
jgi:hypothetical protein